MNTNIYIPAGPISANPWNQNLKPGIEPRPVLWVTGNSTTRLNVHFWHQFFLFNICLFSIFFYLKHKLWDRERGREREWKKKKINNELHPLFQSHPFPVVTPTQTTVPVKARPWVWPNPGAWNSSESLISHSCGRIPATGLSFALPRMWLWKTELEKNSLDLN